jgi:hypothetical protein
MESSLVDSRPVRIRVQTHEGECLLDDVTRPLGVVENIEAVLPFSVVEQVQRHVLA